jgi:ATP synthase F1 gamma subunit
MRSVKATKKITKAMELISASRIVKAQQRVSASTPYANELTRAVSAVASYSSTVHPLTTADENPKRAAILIISADRGMAGAYSNNAIKEGEQLAALLRERGLEVKPYLVGRKAVGYYRFRERFIAGQWTGFSDNPAYENAKEVADSLIKAFVADSDVDATGVDEIHIVFTEFKSMLIQNAMAKRLLPLEVVESDAPVPTGLLPMYEFENDYQPLFAEHGLKFIFLVTPETGEERIRKIDSLCSGFLYAVSSSSTTGNNKAIADQSAYFKRLKEMQLNNPILVGFGIKDKETFQSACQYTNGAIIGSAYIKALEGSTNIQLSTKEFLNNVLK